jgi:hypothetical protein
MKFYKVTSNYHITGQTVFATFEEAKAKADDFADNCISSATEYDLKINERDCETVDVWELDEGVELSEADPECIIYTCKLF